MKKTLTIAGAILALSATLAAADGINLSWSDCGTFGAAMNSFTCNSNSGTPFSMVASFTSPAPMPEFLGLSAQIDLTTNTPALPDWWKHGTGLCRGSAAMSVNFDFTANVNCTDVFVGQAVGGYLYEGGFSVPNRARLLVQCAIPLGTQGPIDDVSEYYGFRANITRTKSTGTGSCPGCPDPVCVVLNEIQLIQPDQFNFNPKVTTAISRNFVTWQTATVPGCPLSTPTRNSSWGQVKSLYR